MASRWKKPFTDILQGPLTTDELRNEAAGLYLVALQNNDPSISNEDVAMWMTQGDKSPEPNRKRLNFAMAIAVMTTVSPTLQAAHRKYLEKRELPSLDLNQSLFYREFDPKSPLVTGLKYLDAAALRVGVAMFRSLTQLDDAGAEWFAAKFSMETVKTLALLFAGYVLTLVAAPLLAAVITAILTVWGFHGLWEEAKRLSGELGDFFKGAVQARTEEDLTKAGGHLARFLVGGGFTAIEMLLFHRLFRGIEGQVAKRVPTPQRLRVEYEQAMKESQSRRQRALDKIKKVEEVVVSGSRGEGMRKLSEGTDWALVAGMVAATAVVGAGLYALSSDSERAP